MLGFRPTAFYGIKDEDIEAKIKAIGVYKDVIRKHPHPRSEKNLKALSVVRGSQSGFEYAEGFQVAFQIWGCE